jgi:hypothetical protein
MRATLINHWVVSSHWLFYHFLFGSTALYFNYSFRMWRESVVSMFNTYQYGMRSQKGHHLMLEDRKLCSYILEKLQQWTCRYQHNICRFINDDIQDCVYKFILKYRYAHSLTSSACLLIWRHLFLSKIICLTEICSKLLLLLLLLLLKWCKVVPVT